MRPLHVLLAVSLFAATATAQLTHVIPNGLATTEGNSSNAFPWGRGSSASLQIQQIYDTTNFTAAGITFPILITRLRWRLNGGVSNTQSMYSQATVDLASATVDAMSPTTNFNNNMGPDRAQVFSGPVTLQTAAATTPGQWWVDIPVTPNFLYDPNSGNDLVIFSDIPPNVGTGVTARQMDVQTTGSLSSRVYNSTAYGSGSGTVNLNHGVVVEVNYIPAQGAALATPYGAGCYNSAVSFYETFAPNTFDLSNSTFVLVPTGSGYAAVPLPPAFFTPTSANLNLTANAVSAAQALPFTFNYPGGTTTSVFVSSNGFIWLQAGGAHGCCNGDPTLLLSLGARFAPAWHDLNPGLGGSVHFDIDPSGTTAYVTWLNVPETGQANTNTMQVALHADGRVEFRYQGCAIFNHTALTGWSPGGNARNPGAIDISAALPFVTGPESTAIALAGAPRPVLGNTVVLTTSNIPAGTPIGATVLSLTQVVPGIDLSALGMPGCFRHAGLDTAVVFAPSGSTGSIQAPVPNQPVLQGVHVFCQSATFSSGFNALGVLTSNGLDLQIGIR